MKKVIVWMLVLVLIASLAGCKKKDKEEIKEPTANVPTEEKENTNGGQLTPGEDTEGENYGEFIPFI